MDDLNQLVRACRPYLTLIKMKRHGPQSRASYLLSACASEGAMVETIHDNIAIDLARENVSPLDDGGRAEIDCFLVGDFVAGAHGG